MENKNTNTSDCRIPSKILKILKHLYAKVETLEEFMRRLRVREGKRNEENLICHSDKNKYIETLTLTLVATPHGSRPLNDDMTLNQLSRQSEVVMRVVERIRRREGRGTNLLTIGYSLMSSDQSAQISTSRSIEYSCPNQNTSRLLYGPWQTLLERVGDKLMEDLLETRAVFVPTTIGNSYVQLSGVPLYELWRFKRSYIASLRTKSPSLKRLQTSLLNNSKQNKRRKCLKMMKSRENINKELNTIEERTNETNEKNGKKEGLRNEKSMKRKCSSEENNEEIKRKKMKSSNEKNDEDEENMKNNARNGNIGENNNNHPSHSVSPDNFLFVLGLISSKHSMLVDAPDKIKDFSSANPNFNFGKNANPHNQINCRNPDVFCGSGNISEEIFLSCKSNETVSEVLNCFELVGVDRELEKSDINTIENIIESQVVTMIVGNESRKKTEKERSRRDKEVTATEELSSTKTTETESHDLTRKKKRKKRRKRTVISDHKPNVPSRPFSNWLLFDRTRTFFSKDFEEHSKPTYVLRGVEANENGVKTLLETIISRDITEETMVHDDDDDDDDDDSASPLSLTEPIDRAKEKLSNILLMLLKNHEKCRYKYLLLFNDDLESLLKEMKDQQKKKKREKEKNKNLINVVAQHYFRESTKVKVGDDSGNIIPSSSSSKKPLRSDSKSRPSYDEMLRQHTNHRDVYLFARACIVRVFPQELFGSKTNRNIFLRNVENLVRLGRFENFSLGQLMQRMKVKGNKKSWLEELKTNNGRLNLLAKVLFWSIDSYVLPLLRSYFYVTDTALHRNRMFYYRKSVWKMIQERGIEDYLNRGIVDQLSKDESTEIITSGNSLGLAYLRFLPKEKSLRPIVNMCRRQTTKEMSINGQLNDLLQVLTYVKDRDPRLVGSSKFSLDDIYETLKRFAMTRKKSVDTRPLYFVKVDLRNCYDTILQEKLFSIVKEALTNPTSKEYIIRRYARVIMGKGKLRRFFTREAVSLDDFRPSFQQHITKVIKDKDLKNVVFVDQVIHAREDCDSILSKLRCLLFGNIVKAGKSFYRQKNGISQGSILSTMLCNLYYGRMEKERLEMIDEENDLLMRQVDDFLYVTPCKEMAVEFLLMMMNGIPEYNCQINREKTLINFDFSNDEIKRLLPQGNASYFPWCGLMINTMTLEVTADYARFADLNVRDTFSIEITEHAGLTMRNKLVFSMRSKCHAIFMDVELNGILIVLENIYKTLVLTSLRFHCYSKSLPIRCSPTRNPVFFVDVIFELSNFLLSHLEILNSSSMSFFPPSFDKFIIRLMCIKVFIKKLRKHESSYKHLIQILCCKCAKLEKILKPEIVSFITNVLRMPLDKFLHDID